MAFFSKINFIRLLKPVYPANGHVREQFPPVATRRTGRRNAAVEGGATSASRIYYADDGLSSSAVFLLVCYCHRDIGPRASGFSSPAPPNNQDAVVSFLMRAEPIRPNAAVNLV